MTWKNEGDAMQYPYLCEHCNLIETHGTNRICDDCKNADFKEADLHQKTAFHLEELYPSALPTCNSCGFMEVSKVGDLLCGNCQYAEYRNYDDSDVLIDQEEEDYYFGYAYRKQETETAINIARAKVELAQAKHKKALAMHDINEAEYKCYFSRFNIEKEGDSELESSRIKLAEAEADIENAETALRAAQDAWVWQ